MKRKNFIGIITLASCSILLAVGSYFVFNQKLLTPIFAQVSSGPMAAMFLGKTGEDFSGIGNAPTNGIADFHIQLENLRNNTDVVKIRVSNSLYAWEWPYNGVNWGINTIKTNIYTDLWFEPRGNAPFTVVVQYSDNTTESATTNYGVPSAHHLSVASSIKDARLNTNEGISLSGNYAYVTANAADRLNVIDISNPLSPAIVGSVYDSSLLDGAEDVFIFGNYVYVTTEALGADRLTIVDVSSSTAPVIIGSVQDHALLNSTEDVFVANGYVYVTAEVGDRLTIIDATNPSNPVVVGSVYDAVKLNGAEGLWVEGNYAYVATEAGYRLTVIDVSNPANPVIVGSVFSGSFLAGASGLSVSGNYAYVTAEFGGYLVIVDISVPANPVIVGRLKSSYFSGTDNIDVVGDYAYLTSVYSNAVTMVNVANKTKPYIVGYIYDNTRLRFSNGIQVVSPYAFVTAELLDGSRTSRFTTVKLPDISIPATDTVAPTVSIITPINNSIIPATGSFVISSSAKDQVGVALMEIYFDSSPIRTCAGVTACSTSYSSANVSPGIHTITVKAYDAEGNMASAQITVIK